MTFRVSVIIPTLNDVTLARTLDALLRQTRQPDEIIVVGRDEAEVSAKYPDVTFCDTGKPVCAAVARNRGLIECSGDLIVFTDSDCIPASDWVELHEAQHFTGHDVVGGGVEIVARSHWAQADNVSMFHDFLASHPPGRRRMLPTLNLSVRSRVIEDVGLLDESFPGAAGEDTDWTVRMRLKGYRLIFEPTAVVTHAPKRLTQRDIYGHWRKSGYASIRVRHRYASDYRTPWFAGNPWLIRVLSPALAAYATARIFGSPLFWGYLRFLPAVYVTKLIYCWGAAAAVADGYAFAPADLPYSSKSIVR